LQCSRTHFRYASSGGSVPESESRRSVLMSLAAAALSARLVGNPNRRRNSAMELPVLRLSRGSFAAARYAVIRDRLTLAQSSLVPAIKELRGCLHYWAGVDETSNTMVNISVWATLQDARQMETLAPMLALASEFTALGVQFERPITNYQSLWEI
jgi:AMMECR1 domain-containing protein